MRTEDDTKNTTTNNTSGLPSVSELEGRFASESKQNGENSVNAQVEAVLTQLCGKPMVAESSHEEDFGALAPLSVLALHEAITKGIYETLLPKHHEHVLRDANASTIEQSLAYYASLLQHTTPDEQGMAMDATMTALVEAASFYNKNMQDVILIPAICAPDGMMTALKRAHDTRFEALISVQAMKDLMTRLAGTYPAVTTMLCMGINGTPTFHHMACLAWQPRKNSNQLIQISCLGDDHSKKPVRLWRDKDVGPKPKVSSLTEMSPVMTIKTIAEIQKWTGGCINLQEYL